MNKKNLSVVMAGAMLATSVAPVLADTTTTNTYEVTKDNAGLLIDKLDKFFADAPKFDKDEETVGEKPVYAYQIKKVGNTNWSNSHSNAVANTNDSVGIGTIDTNEIRLAAKDATNEFEIQVIDLGHKEVDGKIVSTTPGEVARYTSVELTNIANAVKEKNLTEATDEVSYEADENLKTLLGSSTTKANRVINKVTINGLDNGQTEPSKANNLRYITDLSGKTINSLVLYLVSGKTVELKVGADKYDFNKALASEGNKFTGNKTEATAAIVATSAEKSKVIGFAVVAPGKPVDIPSTVKYTIKLENAKDSKVEYKSDDLYDGFMLTETGHTLMNEIKTVKNANKVGYSVDVDKSVVTSGGVSSFEMRITTKGVTKTVVVTGAVEERVKTLRTWFSQGYATVDILAGSNRYATAVEIAKEYAATKYTGTIDGTKEIVLVNGEALVDGLAAAPYAKAKNAPILLTKDNTLPKETKDYLKELIKSDTTVGDLKNIKITIIGGTSVVSRDVVNELKDMGFDSISRLAGDNREETSLEVAEAMSTENSSKNAFIVGANGEADAMSIAPYAASTATPIIVARSATKGLSTSAINDLDSYTGDITIIGGAGVVPESTEETLIEAGIDELNIERIAGERRQETNTMIINKYHKNFNNVLVAKDGTNKKSELVDALPVSIFAATNTTPAPIVLATNKVSDAQVNALVLNRNNNVETVYQVGNGVEKTVMYTIVEKLGLKK